MLNDEATSARVCLRGHVNGKPFAIERSIKRYSCCQSPTNPLLLRCSRLTINKFRANKAKCVLAELSLCVAVKPAAYHLILSHDQLPWSCAYGIYSSNAQTILCIVRHVDLVDCSGRKKGGPKRTALKFEYDGEDLTCLEQRLTQAEIDRILGSDLLVRAVFHGQADVTALLEVFLCLSLRSQTSVLLWLCTNSVFNTTWHCMRFCIVKPFIQAVYLSAICWDQTMFAVLFVTVKQNL